MTHRLKGRAGERCVKNAQMSWACEGGAEDEMDLPGITAGLGTQLFISPAAL